MAGGNPGMAVGIAIPEGIAVGMLVGIAVGIWNAPPGCAVCVPTGGVCGRGGCCIAVAGGCAGTGC